MDARSADAGRVEREREQMLVFRVGAIPVPGCWTPASLKSICWDKHSTGPFFVGGTMVSRGTGYYLYDVHKKVGVC